MDKIDIKISEIHKQESKNLQSSQLVLSLTGKSVSSSVTNTLRRVSLDHIPTYAFPNETIYIETNTSIYNNDYMRLRLSQITIPDVLNKIYFLEDKYWKNIDFRNPDREKHPDDKKVLEVYINAKNTTNEIMNVTTEHVKIYEDGNELKDKFDPKYPCLIIQLRPDEAFSCRCLGVLSIAVNHSIWAAAGNAYFEEVNDNEFKLTIESQSQMDEYEILHKGCRIIKDKIAIIKKLVKDKYNHPSIENTTLLKLEIENEDHTVGGIINDCLQNNTNIVYSGLSKPNLLIDNIIITFQSLKNNPLQYFNETLDYVSKLFDEIQIQIEKLGNNFIKYEKINKATKASK
jgi:DNA-directed RNA polymerase subunit L